MDQSELSVIKELMSSTAYMEACLASSSSSSSSEELDCVDDHPKVDNFVNIINNNSRTGATPCIAPYASELDEIFGDKPLIRSVHTLNSAECNACESDQFPPPSRSSFSPTFSPIPSTHPPTPSRRRKSPQAAHLEAKLELKRQKLKHQKQHLDHLKELEVKKLELLKKIVNK